MNFRTLFFLLVALLCSGRPAFPQTIETEEKPPSVVFKDAAGAVVTSIPVDTDPHRNDEGLIGHRVPVVTMKVSTASNTAYVLNAAGKSRERSLSAVNLATQRVDRVIKVGAGEHVELLMSQDGHRLFCYTRSKEFLWGKPWLEGENPYLASEHVQKSSGTNIITVINTTSNEVVATYDLLRDPAVALPKAKFIDTFLSATNDGERVIVRVNGFAHFWDRLTWQRITVFSVQSPNPVVMIDPGKTPIVSYKLSQNDKFLFAAAEDKRGHSEVIDIANLEKGTTISRLVDDPPTRRERLGAFLEGAPPSGAGSKQGIWIFTRGGLRFISEAGEMGDEISLPREDNVAAMLSLDKTLFFVAVPDSSQHSGVLDVVDLTKGTSSKRALTDAPIRLIRLGSGSGLWIVGRQEMRPISEAGELGDRPILLNKPRRTEEGDTSGADAFLNGDPTEAISIGEDHAAILINNKKGGGESPHLVALLDLKQFQVDSIVATMTRQEQAKILRGRYLQSLARGVIRQESLLAGGPAAFVAYFTDVSPNLRFANESLAARPDGRKLYVLDTDSHEVTVIDVQTAAVTERIPVHKSVTTIQVAPDGKHLICAGKRLLRDIDLESNKVAN
jgi:YVTN family beta-propeller protein